MAVYALPATVTSDPFGLRQFVAPIAEAFCFDLG
jgi:hypothetical protein